ncbi:hypothetical protein LB559_07675 [Mesorhizobium sp. BR1-1-3]|uniref:hypothetical protein n=1 Tax=Mesorhizobium sp. BR1-1-3 TaxID=2876651 RepID=UPI001CD11DAD|nr:hypothetical protein [Mesorhizobium sp. BR1-1-3]MBZ9887812.1 hypothetical protein [Mesorhizobium sp. BR1-1-3]
MLRSVRTIIEAEIQACCDGAAVEIVDTVEIDLEIPAVGFMQAAADKFAAQAGSQHDRRTLDGIGAENEEIAADLVFLAVMAERDRTDSTADVIEPAHFRTEADRDVGMLEDVHQPVVDGEFGVDRAQPATQIGTARAALRGRHASPRGWHDEVLVGLRRLHHPVRCRHAMRRLRKRLRAGQHRRHVGVAGDRHDVFRVAVERLDVVITDRPVIADAVGAFQPEIIGMKSWRLREPAVRPATQSDRVVPRLVGIGLVGRLVFDVGVDVLFELPFMGVVASPLQHQNARLSAPGELMQEEGRTEAGTDRDEIEMILGDLLRLYVQHHQLQLHTEIRAQPQRPQAVCGPVLHPSARARSHAAILPIE